MTARSEPSVNTPRSTDTLWSAGEPCPYDDLIDVRSPGEFAEDHIPGAVNLPVLDNEERAHVGTLFHQQGAFLARKVGAALVSANIARHLHEHFADKPKEYRPFVYCWRGGQRSSSLATVLSQIGWRVTVLRGGYRTYRAHVRQRLDDVPASLNFQIIAGPTGSGKTRFLGALAAHGGQVLDLEALANHRGSILGTVGPQPLQKWFESQLLAVLEQFDPARPVWVEAESQRIGNLYLPSVLWERMQAADGWELRVPLSERVRFLVEEYAELRANPELLKKYLRILGPRHGARRIDQWCQAVDAQAWDELVLDLLEVHYDPAYQWSSRRWFPNVTRTAALADRTAAEEFAERMVSCAPINVSPED